MHAGFGPIRISQSTASFVAYMDKNNPILFATGSSAPCTSLFKPFWVDCASFLNNEPAPTHEADANSLFWSHERLHRAVLENYRERLAAYANERDEMEARFITGALKLQNAPLQERADFTRACYAEALAAEADWLKRVQAVPSSKSIFHAMAWDGFSKKAGLAG